MNTAQLAENAIPIHRVPLTRPLVWLGEGWNDLLHHRGASLVYGAMVTLLGAIILAYNRHPVYLAAVTCGFLLAGPVFTAGLCELSRRQDVNESTDFAASLRALRPNADHLLAFAGFLSLLTALWFAVSGWLYFRIAGSVAPSLEATVWGDVMRHISDTQLVAYAVIGTVLAVAVFAVSVVSVPMILDRHVSAACAMRTSLRVLVRDLPAMAVWALLIAALVAIGFLTQLIAMIVIFPLLGHATWRAYRELVEH